MGSSHEDWLGLAKAIMTTDTFPKLVSKQFTLPSDPNTTYCIAGVSKGAGMIHPNMGTLLSVVCTDVKIPQTRLRSLTSIAARDSFNRITIDGDTSTNDSVVVFANGAAAPTDSSSKMSGADGETVQEILNEVMKDLAKLVVRDGEGATKFITVEVKGNDKKLAIRVARGVATSSLVKTAMYGRDANWGRILCAIGNVSSASKDPGLEKHKVTVGFALPQSTTGEVMPLVTRGQPINDIDEVLAKTILDEEDITIKIDLSDTGDDSGANKHLVRYWTCDFSHEYVTINADYRT